MVTGPPAENIQHVIEFFFLKTRDKEGNSERRLLFFYSGIREISIQTVLINY